MGFQQPWFLVDAEKRADAHPSTFTIPPRKDREALQVDAFAKLVFTDSPLFAKNKGERMWVRVMNVKADGKYRGMLFNNPVLVTGIKSGELIEFGPENVIDILPADVVIDPQVKQDDKLNEPIDFTATAPKKTGGGGIVIALALVAFAFGKKKRRR